MSGARIILDFDRTVFDMESLYTEIDKTNPDAKLGTVESLEDINLEELIFPDARQFLLDHADHIVTIVSSCYGKTGQWDLEYQTEKMRRSGIYDLVSDVHVVPADKIASIEQLSKGQPVIFVDDHPAHVQAVAAALPYVQVVYLDRLAEFAIDSNVPRIASLSELDTVIAKHPHQRGGR